MLIAVYLTVGRRFDEQRQQKHSHVVDVCVCVSERGNYRAMIDAES